LAHRVVRGRAEGFLPLQDTGVIVAVTEAEQSISIPRMSELQAARPS